MAARADERNATAASDQSFVNPFHINDIGVFDDETLRDLLRHGAVNDETLVLALHDAPPVLRQRVAAALPQWRRQALLATSRHPTTNAVIAAQARLLDAVFWELTYWQTPDLYEELTEGERLHPGIFRRLTPTLRDRVVLDAGCGSGRATFDCLKHGASHVYAVDPSPGLLRILARKQHSHHATTRVTALRGRFESLPLADDSVDVTLSCAAFTAAPELGGEPGLVEMRRVTRDGGLIILIWPRPDDLAWLAAHGFHHVTIPLHHEMMVHYRSFGSALRVARRFYAHNHAVSAYLWQHRRPEIPFSVLGMNPPNDYVWLSVTK